MTATIPDDQLRQISWAITWARRHIERQYGKLDTVDGAAAMRDLNELEEWLLAVYPNKREIIAPWLVVLLP